MADYDQESEYLMSRLSKTYEKFKDDRSYLVERLQDNDREALGYIFDLYARPLYGYCNSILKDYDSAQDTVQKTFLSFLEIKGRYTSIEAVRSFLYQTAHNKCMDQLKHDKVIQKHLLPVALELQQDFFNEKMIEEELLGQLHRSIEELPEACAKVFRLSLDNCSNQEIADRLSISINTVKTQKQRAMSFLKKRFSPFVLLVLIRLERRERKISN